ncbi:MAG: MmcQ/YjbR family DNA-binding protein [Clostridia bacterium]|nr:MmcQ/YjbR family DNA-binding protein [Clostridia bacterium]
MRDLNNNLKKSIINYNKLSNFGFSEEKGVYLYKELILEGEFEVQIFIENDKKYSKVIDIESNEEYALVDIEDAVGEFIGTVRYEYDKVINRFIEECTKKEIFKAKQSKELIKYIKEKYGDELEFLWEKFDDNGIWRCKKNNKWYATLFTVSGDKLGINSSKIIEVSNVMYEKDKVQEIIDNKTIFPAYHMNKRSWITIKLDDEINMETVYELIDNSYEICNNKH